MRKTIAVAIAVLAVGALAARHLRAQQTRPESKLAFEVATIKLAAANTQRQTEMIPVSPDRISIRNMALSTLIYTAYGEGMNTSTGVRGGPDWLNQTAYAIEAQAQQPSTRRQFQAMLRTLLEDRFGLKVHTETNQGNIYALVVDRSDGKLGPKVQAWDGTCAGGQMPLPDDDRVYPRCLSGYAPPGIRLDGATMYSVADLLSLPASRSILGRVVQDRTGLSGRFKMELEYPFFLPRPDPAAPDPRPSLFTAIQEQWGLKLEPAQGQFKVIMVDEARRPTEN